MICDVRIGNDIRIDAELRGINEYSRGAVKQIRAFLINKSDQMQPKIPVDVCRCNCGCRGYHFYPKHCCGCNPMFGPAPLPNRFCFHNNWCCGNYCNRGCMNSYFIPDRQLDRYLAISKLTGEENKIQVYFPAKDQLKCGTYKMVIVVSMFESGWGKSDIHTYTIDYGDMFTLVDDETGESGYIHIDADNASGHTPDDDHDYSGTIPDATKDIFGKVRLAENEDLLNNATSENDDDVVTAKVFRDNALNATVDGSTLRFDIGVDSDGSLDLA